MKFLLPFLFALSTANASFFIPDNSIRSTKMAQGDAFEQRNLTLAQSIASSALTISIKDYLGNTPTAISAARVALRHPTLTTGTYNRRDVTGALSLTINSGTKLDFVAATAKNLYFYLVDSNGSGTMKLAASTSRFDTTVLQSTVAESFTGTVTIASPGVWTANGHGLSDGDAVSVTTTGALPTGLVAGTTYYIKSSATNSFNLAATPGGTAINTTGSQSGIHTLHLANGRLVSDAVYSNVAIRYIGRGSYTLATPGTWTVATMLSSGDSYLPRIQSQIFTISNGATWYAPWGTDSNTVFKVTCTGAGGGGGAGSGSTGGGGGGAGGTCIKFLSGITPLTAEAVTIGVAGAAASSGSDGGNGGTTVFGSGLCSATGGHGGYSNVNGVQGGNGGIGSSADLNLTGGAGSGGYTVSGVGNICGAGGNSQWGGGGAGAGPSTSSFNGALGGGGGGGNSATNSGAGGQGVCVIEWGQ